MRPLGSRPSLGKKEEKHLISFFPSLGFCFLSFFFFFLSLSPHHKMNSGPLLSIPLPSGPYLTFPRRCRRPSSAPREESTERLGRGCVGEARRHEQCTARRVPAADALSEKERREERGPERLRRQQDGRLRPTSWSTISDHSCGAAPGETAASAEATRPSATVSPMRFPAVVTRPVHATASATGRNCSEARRPGSA